MFGGINPYVSIFVFVFGDAWLYTSTLEKSCESRALDVGIVITILFIYACVLGEREKNSSDKVLPFFSIGYYTTSYYIYIFLSIKKVLVLNYYVLQVLTPSIFNVTPIVPTLLRKRISKR
jgi:Na+/alanine symporter